MMQSSELLIAFLRLGGVLSRPWQVWPHCLTLCNDSRNLTEAPPSAANAEHAGPGADAGAMPDPNLTTPPNCIHLMNRTSFKKTDSDGIIRWEWRYRNISGERQECGYELSYAAMQIGHSITRSEIAARIRMVRDYLKQHIAKDLADFDLEQRKREAGVIDFLARRLY